MSGSIFHPFVLDNAAGQDTVVGIGSDSEKYGVGISSHVHITGIGTFSDLLHTTGVIHAVGGIKDTSGDIGNSGQVLSSTGSGLNWINPGDASVENASNIGVNLYSTNADQFVTFVGSNSGNNPIRVDAGLKYNPSSNKLFVKEIVSTAGNLELQAATGENGVIIKDNNAVELYFDGSSTYKLATKTDGVDVRGELEADSLNVTGISTVGALTIDVNGNNSGTTTLLTLDNYVGADITQEYTWIDFTFRDSNANATPQVKIGAQAKDPTGNQTQEGTADFVVQCGVDLNSTSNTMTEMFRCSHETKIISVHHHPQTHSNFDLGSNNLRWRNLYATIIRDKDNQTGTSGQILSSTGTEISWINVGDISAGSAARIAVTDQSSDTTCFPVFTQAATGNQLPHTVSSLTFNSSTGALSAASFSGSIAASNINSGTLGTDRIPNLNASKINAGTLGTDRIPNLAASKITSGTLGTDRIPSLAASKITSGTLGTDRIPNLAASKITSGTLGTARIPNLAASKITSGTLGTDRIPSLAASKITSGQFDTARIPTLNQNTTGTSGGLSGSPSITVTNITIDGQLRDGDNAFGSSGQVLSSDGTDTKWINAGSLSAGAAAQVAVNATNTTNSSHFIAFTETSSGNEEIRVDNSLTYNPSTNVLTAGTFSGSVAASNVDSGTLGTDRIPNLAASKITSGTLGTDRIPNLAASKITSGTLGTDRIPNLAASKITSGTLGTDRIPNLAASKITSGTLGTDRIPNLVASKITSGTLGTDRIPNLAASKITSGQFDAARIPTLNQDTTGTADKAETARIVTDNTSAIRPILFIASSGNSNAAVNNTFAPLRFSPTIYSLSYNPNTEIFYVNKAQLNKIQVSSGSAGNAGQVLTSGGSGSNMTWTYPVPSGGIIIWSGAANAIPSGWVLCDGNNGTPDLRGRFVVGYSNTDNDYDVDDTGGNKQQTLAINQMPSHNHGVTDSGHTHNLLYNHGAFGGTSGAVTPRSGNTPVTPGISGRVSTQTTGISINNTGGNSPVDVRPPYYALCYIMKT